MKSKILFQSNENHYFQDINSNYLLFLPFELFHQIEKCLDTPSFAVKDSTNYYERKARFLLEKLENKKNIEQNLSGRLTSETIENTLANTRQVTFELTEQCNLKCKYCGYGELYNDYLPRQNKDLPFEYVKHLIEYLNAYWTSSKYTSVNRTIAIGFYGGEPLLKVDLIKQIIQLLKTKCTDSISFTFHMTTNGMLLDQYMDFLVENNIQLLISLDGDEHNNSYRVDKFGKNHFHSILSNIVLLQERFPEYFKKKVNIASVLHNRNSVSEIYNFFQNQFDKKARISEVNPMGIKHKKKEQFNVMYKKGIESLNQAEDYNKIKEELFIKEPDTNTLLHYFHAYSGNYFKNFESFFIDKKTVKWVPTGTCLPFSKKIFLTVGGKILPCERIGHQYIIGHVGENGVNIDFNEIANKYNLYYDNLLSQCSNCYRLKNCLQCIFHVEDIENKPVCNGYFDEEKFKEYLSNNISFLSKNPELYNKIMTEVVLED